MDLKDVPEESFKGPNSKIMVVLYSYKNKQLPDYINKLMANAIHKDSIRIKLYDQTNMERPSHFEHVYLLEYNHVRWDDYRGPNYYRIRALKEKSQFVLIMSDKFLATPGWDQKLLSLVSNDKVISMHGKEHISNDTFFVYDNREDSEEITESVMVNTDFIFAPYPIAYRLVNKVDEFKVNGINEAMSIELVKNGIGVISMPSSFLTDFPNERPLDYVPYSKNHNYSKLYNLLLSDDGKKFCSLANIDVAIMKEYPYQQNDVEYHGAMSSLDRMPSGSKFHKMHHQILFTQRDKKYQK